MPSLPKKRVPVGDDVPLDSPPPVKAVQVAAEIVAPTQYNEDVERVARWIHETVLNSPQRGTMRAWSVVMQESKEVYRVVARELLTNPPSQLKGKK